MPAIITSKLRIYNAKQFTEALTETELSTLYMFVGKVTPWEGDDGDPSAPLDHAESERLAWEDMIGGKKILPSEVSHAIRRVDWTSGQAYVRYNDQDDEIFLKNFYVMTDEFNVYKCIDNNIGEPSTVKPTGTGTSVLTLGDGYKWKYLYTLNAAEACNFTTPKWMPVKEILTDDGSSQWTVQQTAIDGAIHAIQITSAGTGYTSAPTVTIDGDGTGATATATINGGVVENINVTNAGSGYTEATVSLSGGGFTTPATARVIYSPEGGHGAAPLKELGGFYVMVGSTLTEDEMGDLPVTNDFRKIGILLDPYDFGTTDIATVATFKETYALNLTGGVTGDFLGDEEVSGTLSGAVGKVVSFDDVNEILYVTNITGEFQDGEGISTTSGSSTIDTVDNPELEPRSGDVVFLEYRPPIARADDQSEQIRVIFEF